MLLEKIFRNSLQHLLGIVRELVETERKMSESLKKFQKE